MDSNHSSNGDGWMDEEYNTEEWLKKVFQCHSSVLYSTSQYNTTIRQYN
jgi:hypothetical protein